MYESVSELIQKLWTSRRIFGEGVVQDRDGGEILTEGHAEVEVSYRDSLEHLRF